MRSSDLACDRRQSGARRIGECTYCGAWGELGRDHVPPRNLFPRPRPHNLITVPCCDSCNGAAASDDEYFRTNLLPREDIAEHPQAALVWPTEMRGLSRVQKAATRRNILERMSKVRVRTPAGVYLGERMVYSVENARLSRVCSRIIQGLFFHQTGQRLSDSYFAVSFFNDAHVEVRSTRGNHEFDETFVRYVRGFHSLPEIILGDGVFSYRFKLFDDSDPSKSGWLLVFYDAATFIGVTANRSILKEEWRHLIFP